jgi:hypothetical protein
VASTALAGASTDPKSVLASSYKDYDINFKDMTAVVQAAASDIQKKMEMLVANHENISVVDISSYRWR